ncbi:Flagellar L-ring protein [Vibrio stylophorae]|uniref:Flagellar L-ring protein n=2 Tax=Vibrio stylophorae TaxID=659351 RepID=A0ABM8ZUY0_9VIBR|nr:Flagellar L-ring protein [Vibrio stylophorae]
MRILWMLVLLSLSGCASLLQPVEPEKQEVANTTVDAVEGNQDQSGGLVDAIRRRDDPVAGDPSWAPVKPQQPEESYTAATGSLFNAGKVQDLYDDTKPHGVGDIVTVMLEERTQAKKSATSDMEKSNDLSMDPLSLGGQEVKIKDRTLSYKMSNDNKFTGSATADQSNSIKGSITVEVVEVLANGNLVIRGEKWLTLNTGEEYIRLSGTIRPDDIAHDNTVASTRISNARIQYSGTGDRQDTQEQGWLARFFNVTI